MPTIKTITHKLNKTDPEPPTSNRERTCNVIYSKRCPLQKKCLTNHILYKSTLTPNQDNYQHQIYYGITETKFKQLYEDYMML